MKLSEAIRLGSMLKPQGSNGWVGDKSCALNAAADALGVPPTYDDWHMKHCVNYKVLRELFAFLNTENTPCPECNGRQINTGIAIWHLNDEHLWTRERIADWVESIEAAQDAPKPEAVEVAR